MNKVVSINLNGIVFNIEEQAYDRLKSYIDRLRVHFQGTEGSAEIISDIESRIAELLQLKLNDRNTVVQLTDVEEVIAMMGDPGQIDGEEQASSQQQEKSQAWAPRRLRRDPRNKVLGGVCAGVSNYMGIDPLLPRALFLISFFIFGTGLLLYIILWIALPQANVFDLPDNPNLRSRRVFRNPDERTIGGVCSGVAAYMGIDTVWIRLAFLVSVFVFGSGILLYLILWVVIPLARTSAEKLQMKGEPIDVSNIERKVKEAFTASGRQFSKGMDRASNSYQAGAGSMSRGVDMAGQAATQILKLAGRVFGFVVVTIGITILIALLMAAFGAGDMNHITRFGKMFAGSDKVFYAATIGGGLFLLSVGLSFLIGGAKLLFNLQFRTRVFNIMFAFMCFAGIMLSVYAAGSYAMTIDEEGSVTEKINADHVPDTLYMNVSDRWKDSAGSHSSWLRVQSGMGPGTCKMRVIKDEGVVMLTGKIFMKPSTDAGMQLTLLKKARGADHEEALENAQQVDYRVQHTDGRLVFDAGVMIPDGTPFKYQQASVKMKVPVGTVIIPDRHVRAMIHRALRSDGKRGKGETYRMTANGLECIDCEETEENDWEDRHHRGKHDDVHIDIDEDGDEGEKKVKIRIGSSDKEEGITIETNTNEDGEEVQVKKEVTKVGPVIIEETVKKKQKDK